MKILFIYVIVSLLCETTLGAKDHSKLLRNAYSKIGESDISTTTTRTTSTTTAETTTTTTTSSSSNANTTLSSGPAGNATGQEQEKEPSKGSLAGENKKKSLDYSHIQRNKILNYNQLHIKETDLGKFTLIRTEQGNR